MTKMNKLNDTPDNIARVKTLKKIKETQWVGNIKHDTLDKCVVIINLFHSSNSGMYDPKVTRIDGVAGYFIINEDGKLNFESRIIKESNNVYRIEHLSETGYDNFQYNYYDVLYTI